MKLLSSSFSSFSQIKVRSPVLVSLKFFSCEELQEKGCAWKWPFHYLWIEAAGECFEKGHPNVKMKEVVLPQVSSPAVKPYVFPMIKLVHTAIASLPASPWLLPSVQLCWGHYSKICSCPQPFPHIFICHTYSFLLDESRRVFVRVSIWTPALKSESTWGKGW